jgi:GNAT superfamily N-acetyltransferase
MVSIRPASQSDISLIAQFIRELAEYERLVDACVVSKDSLALHLFGEHPKAEVFIGELDGAPVGFSLFFANFSTFLGKPGLYLEDLFVRPDARGKGVGKALLTNLIQLAATRGYGRVEWAVLDWNKPAIAFYESMGAKPMQDWTVFRIEL